MKLPVMPPVRPMLGRATYEVPTGPGLLYEPKWDGFRCVAFRDGDEVELGSRRERPFTRYFPEVAADLARALPERCVVDGELVIVTERGLDFMALQSRIHPAASRVARLAAEVPATFVAFDLLALGDRDLRPAPFAERRRLLEQAVRAPDGVRVHVTPVTANADQARDWFRRFRGAGFDGVVAKPVDGPYEEGRRAQLKVKHLRTADCVVVAAKRHKDGEGIGSLLLALVGDDGALHAVGAAASFTAAHRRRLLDDVAPWRDGAERLAPWDRAADVAVQPEAAPAEPGGPSDPGGPPPERWGRLLELGWEPLRPERVAEVRYDPVSEPWFRSTARFVRWRDDKDAVDCHQTQIEVVPPIELTGLLT